MSVFADACSPITDRRARRRRPASVARRASACTSRANADDSSAADYYPLQDLLYRTAALTDDGGNVVEAYDTDAYGRTLIFDSPGSDSTWFTDYDTATDTPTCEFLFTGRRYDPESEFYFYRARYYNPTLGRFLQRDPIGYVDGMGLYEYVRSDPLMFVDPLGLDRYVGWEGPHGYLLVDIWGYNTRTKEWHRTGLANRYDFNVQPFHPFAILGVIAGPGWVRHCVSGIPGDAERIRSAWWEDQSLENAVASHMLKPPPYSLLLHNSANWPKYMSQVGLGTPPPLHLTGLWDALEDAINEFLTIEALEAVSKPVP